MYVSQTMSLGLICCLGLINAVFGRKDLRGGCTVEDLVFFNDVTAEMQDILTVTQNSGSNSDEFVEFFETGTTEDLEYLVEDESGFVFASYSSRDELINNIISDLNVFGRLWVYVMSGYGKCSSDSSSSTSSDDYGSGGFRTATYIARGGDNLRGETENIMFLDRVEISFEKQGKNDWKINKVFIEVVSDFGSFAKD